MSSGLSNPFAVKTPETMSAHEVVDLFVPVAESFDMAGPGHLFVHGHRGSGKSMMFRLMSPDCQTLKQNSNIQSLPYYGVYLSIKATDLNVPEFRRLEGQLAGFILSEHVLVGYLTIKTLQSLAENLAAEIDKLGLLEELRNFCDTSIIARLRSVGWDGAMDSLAQATSADDLLSRVIEIMNMTHVQAIQYLKRLTFIKDIFPFDGPLLGFQDFLLPLLRELRPLSFMPHGPIYLLIDDADNLNLQQTQVLNTWVSYRTTADLSLKISTQLSYKSYLTASGQRIESPHDYSEVFISAIHTGPAKEKYPQWVGEIVRKRLQQFEIWADPRDFYPPDEDQERAIQEIADEYKRNWKPNSGSYRPGDDAYRYARPEYMKRLSGPAKHGSDYRYAGFDQLVHISSGIIRFFLDPASKMFSEQQKRSGSDPVMFISPPIQDKIIKEASDDILLSEFEKLIDDVDQSSDGAPENVQKMRKLRNLIYTIGAMFREILLSDRSERRVFSFAISDEPDQEVRAILRLGIQYGFFYLSSIGTKEGMGRTRLYVLTRRLAPFFKLDPTGFSGYKFVTNAFLSSALVKPKRTQNLMKRIGVDAVTSQHQQAFDFDEKSNED